MKKIILVLFVGVLFCTTTWAQSSCFLAQENQTVLKQQGNDCNQRYSPASTFKIPLSLMGFDSGILKDTLHPEWPYKKEYELFLNVWKDPHNPRTWIRDSCVWYSQVLTQKLGMKQFKNYVDAFEYGNRDVSGDKGQNNGLTHAWLSSSLAISPVEQIEFLQKIIHKKIPVSPKAFAMTKEIIYIQELAGGWKLYGKTGTGQHLSKEKSQNPIPHGWFIGWIEKNDRVITFASFISDDKKKDTFISFRAKSEAVNKLFYLINELEK